MFKNISIKNYKKINQLSLNELKQFNIFVGKNNVGKTSILEAIYVLINPSNPQLPFNTNIHRNIDIINTQFWKNIFYKFNESNRVSLAAKMQNELEVVVNISGNQNSDETIQISNNSLMNNDLMKRDTDSETNEINGLNINFKLTYPDKSSREYFAQSKSIEQFDQDGKKSIRIDFNKAKEFEEYMQGYYLNNITLKNKSEMSNRWDEINKENKEDKLVAFLQEFEASISKIDLDVGRNIQVKDTRFDQKILLNTFGEGMIKSFLVLMTIYRTLKGVVLIDEVENGLDPIAQKYFWKSIFQSAIENRTQVFMTSHSLEMIKNFNEIASELECSDKISVIRIQSRDNELYSTSLSSENLDHAFKESWEIR